MDEVCPHCGFHSNDEGPRFCSSCGARMDGNIPARSEGFLLSGPGLKSPSIAGFCSSVLPGLGQVYNGETAKGYAIFLLTLLGLVVFIVPGLVVWIYAVYDAHSVAGKIGAPNPDDRQTPVFQLVLFILVALVVVVAVILLAIIFLMSLLAAQLGPGGTRYLYSLF